MTNKEFQELLRQYPDDMPVNVWIDIQDIREYIPDYLGEHSKTAFVNDDGDIELGEGERYLLVNYPQV